MKRVQEKIKDLVDVRSYETVKNFASDSGATVGAYRFTDATADLMAKWLDEVVEINHRPAGAARALAGNRGVGKSHFLSVLGALAAHPELRTRLTDQHVGMSAQRLPRQKYFVVTVERGLGEMLVEELRNALDKTFGNDGTNWGDSAGQMMAIAASKTGELPLIVIVDSAYDRKARVKRDDGEILGEMAEAARTARAFLAIALDDDIAGADGVNAAIVRTCQIDFLDQEHLYRIVEAFLFQKRASARTILRELYQGFREAAPGFNWSEPRFAALYPIHPVVVDVTPAVRLYAPKFAFLPFAAENTAKVMNRPAHSLLALDEVFDRVELDLRKSPELEESFAAYDELAETAVSQIPIMQRLQAKLILKGLFLLSLDGRGATARELGAAMLIYDENSPPAAIQKIEDMIAIFANAVSTEKLRRTPDGGETRYSLGNSASADFEAKLAEAAQTVEPSAIGRVLRRIGQARFPDWIFGDFGATGDEPAADFQVHWRGSTRRGQIVWAWNDAPQTAPDAEHYDWQIFITPENFNAEAGQILWQPAALRLDEEDAVRRFAALTGNSELAAENNEAAIAAEQTIAAVIERIWARIFLEEGKLIFGGEGQTFTPEAKAARSLTETLEIALAPVFDARFPAHPNFDYPLTAGEVSQIVGELFSGANVSAVNTQKLAETFALPLGLVAERGANFVLETDENLLKLPLVQTILQETGAANGRGVELKNLHSKLKTPPHGLSREAQNLLLAALVARRRLEFVTSTNDRITHRSLDLQIIWADVVGVAQSSVQPRTSAELANWATLLTGAENLISVDEPAEREKITAALKTWSNHWKKTRVTERFDELPDEVLNVRAWRTAAQVGRSFGASAEAVREILANEIALEEGLERVIDAFADSPEEVETSRGQLDSLESFIHAAQLRQTVWRYIARAEATDDEAIETLRQEILEELALTENAFAPEFAQMFERMWDEFRHLYIEFYLARHNAAMYSPTRTEFLEKIEQSAEWAEFAGLAGLPISHPQFLESANRLRGEIRAAKCSFDVRGTLQTQPFCACGFRLIRAEGLERKPQELANTVQLGRATLRRMIGALAAPLATALTEIAEEEPNPDFVHRARAFAEALRRNAELPMLSPLDLRLLSQAVGKMPASTVTVRPPRGLGAVSREKMRQRLNQWLDNFPNAPVLVKFQEEE